MCEYTTLLNHVTFNAVHNLASRWQLYLICDGDRKARHILPVWPCILYLYGTSGTGCVQSWLQRCYLLPSTLTAMLVAVPQHRNILNYIFLASPFFNYYFKQDIRLISNIVQFLRLICYMQNASHLNGNLAPIGLLTCSWRSQSLCEWATISLIYVTLTVSTQTGWKGHQSVADMSRKQLLCRVSAPAATPHLRSHQYQKQMKAGDSPETFDAHLQSPPPPPSWCVYDMMSCMQLKNQTQAPLWSCPCTLNAVCLMITWHTCMTSLACNQIHMSPSPVSPSSLYLWLEFFPSF